MKIKFLGATQTVTGSKYLIEAGSTKILVDCGLFQGYKELRLRNWNPLPVNPATIDFVLLTHAHIDHSGYIPLLVKNGFRGKILCSAATKDLCAILLPDSGHLQEEEARYANRKAYSKHHPALPLYTRQDAERSLEYFQPLPFDNKIQLAEELNVSFHYAGHILGASLVKIEHYEMSVLFSGDLGRGHDPIMNDPQPPPQADYLVVESTYGNRLHKQTNPEQQLEEVINRTVERGGVVIIPVFAVGRAQAALYHIYQLKQQHKIPDIPVFVDSPMATDATKLFYHHASLHRLSKTETAAVCRVAKYTHSTEESMEIDQNKGPMIILSASGMATGGRVIHHIKNFASDPRNTILFTGYQAGGTRGDRMVRGESEVKMLGVTVPINAEIAQLDNMSAHADYQEMLTWLASGNLAPRKVFIIHGEHGAAEALKDKIHERFAWECVVPAYCDEEELV